MPFARRPHFDWPLGPRTLALGPRTLVMGILNLTPDSFSDGGQLLDPNRALDHAHTLLEAGADLLDLGGESTRPGATPLSAQQEIDRVLPVLEALLRSDPEIVISIDTYKSATARAALAAGALIVNDVSGLLWDPAMAATCATASCGLVLMHTRGTPSGWRTLPPLPREEVLPLVHRELAARLAAATAAGIAPRRIVLDPGYGFGKAFDANYPLLAHQDALATLGRPLLAGVSRKSFLGRTLAQATGVSNQSAPVQQDIPAQARGNATLAAATAALLNGAHILRVHDVTPALEAARIADAILNAL